MSSYMYSNLRISVGIEDNTDKNVCEILEAINKCIRSK